MGGKYVNEFMMNTARPLLICTCLKRGNLLIPNTLIPFLMNKKNMVSASNPRSPDYQRVLTNHLKIRTTTIS